MIGRLRFTLPLLAALLSACTFQVSERNFIRATPDPTDAPAPAANFAGLPGRIEVHAIPAAADADLHAVWLKQPGSRFTVLFFGGNMSRISSGGRRVAEHLLPFGVDLFIVDHRGSGRSEGQPELELLLGDALTAFDFLTTQLAVPADRVIVQGHSLGSFMAGQVARHRRVAGLVLSGSATTTEDWVNALIPWYYKPIVRTEIDPKLHGRGNLSVVEAQSAPLLIIAGGRDKQTPAWLSRKLADAAAAKQRRATLVVAKHGEHESLFDQPEVLDAYRRFLATL